MGIPFERFRRIRERGVGETLEPLVNAGRGEWFKGSGRRDRGTIVSLVRAENNCLKIWDTVAAPKRIERFLDRYASRRIRDKMTEVSKHIDDQYKARNQPNMTIAGIAA